MDPLTHALTGALLARAGLNRAASRVAPLAVVASVWPDVDVAALLVSDIFYLELHRGWTHALVAQPAQAALLTLAWRWWAERKETIGRGALLRACLAAWFCLTLHVFFDTWNVYGVRPFIPWSWAWIRFDWVHVFDIWIWAVLLCGLLAPMLARLVDSEIGARSGGGAGAAWMAFSLVAVYVGGRAVLHDRAVAAVESRLIRGETPLRVIAIPGAANPLRWKAVVETAGAWHILDAPLAGELDPEQAVTFYKPEPSVLVEKARSSATGRVFFDFAQAPAWRLMPGARVEGTTEVRVTDLRFSTPASGGFSSDWLFDAQGRVLSEAFHFETKP